MPTDDLLSMCTAKKSIKIYLQTINMLSFRELHDVAENWVLMFKLLVGGNLYIFEILVFQKGFLGGYTACRKILF